MIQGRAEVAMCLSLAATAGESSRVGIRASSVVLLGAWQKIGLPACPAQAVHLTAMGGHHSNMEPCCRRIERYMAHAFDLKLIRGLSARVPRETCVRRVETHQQIGSTNDRALELAALAEAATPLLVIAAEQTAGRGRGANRWWSGPGR